MNFPKMFLAERKRESPKIEDVRQAIVADIQKLNLRSKIWGGEGNYDGVSKAV